MKKSELIEQVEDLIWRSMGHSTDITTRDARNLAEDILDLIQEVGMQPPLKKRCPVLHTDTHAWEDEG